MNSFRWLIRSLRFHRRLHLALAGGAMLATAVLAAALLTGGALNRNLHQLALARIGGIRSAIELRGRWVEGALAERLARETGAPVAPVVRLSASVLAMEAAGDETPLHGVQAYGVDHRFPDLCAATHPPPGRAGPPDPPPQQAPYAGVPKLHPPPGRAGPPDPPRADALARPYLPAGEILLSRALQAALSSTGVALSLRFEHPSFFPPEMPLGDARGDQALRRPVQLRGEQTDAALGGLALVARSSPPYNLFASRDWLAAQAGVDTRVNLFLSGAEPAQLAAALQRALLPADLGVTTTAATNGAWLVRADRIYLDEAHVRALATIQPSPVLALHHLVDALVSTSQTVRQTPYSFITALSPSDDARLGVVPANMPDDAIMINAWLAEKLSLTQGDALTLHGRRLAPGGKWIAETATFRVAGVLAMDACTPERERLPNFPGLSDVERCADWNIGIPMDPTMLADPDNEAYWKAFGPTPKAFITYAAGQRLFGTYFGPAMTARLAPEIGAATIQDALRRAAPAELGLSVRPVRQEALQSAAQAMDFRQLFAGMAFVLMIAALLLTGMLASLGVAYRREEVGVLRAAGFAPWQLFALWLAESLPPLLAGVVAGVGLGIGGASALVWSINRFWSDAVAATPITFLLEWRTAVVAGGVALVLSLLAVCGGVGRAWRVPVRLLLGDQTEEDIASTGRAWTIRNFALGIGAAVIAIALLAAGNQADATTAAGIFFGAGLLLLLSLLCWARLLAHFLGSATTGPATGPLWAGIRNVTRHPGRSLLVMALLAVGTFLTVGTLSMKQDPAAHLKRTDSGSGGMTALVELSLPEPGRRCEERIRQALGEAGTLLSFRVHEGDEAGCLNLQRAQQPRLLGVALDEAKACRAFVPAGEASAAFWAQLQKPLPDGTIPVLAGDRTTLEYGLHARARGATIYTYTGEDGRNWRLRVVGTLPVRTSVLQGSLLMDERILACIYPSAPGHRLWLVRSAGPEAEMAARLRQALGRSGGVVTLARERLQLLGAVEDAYLEMFLVLGGLGVILGAAGVGLVVLRQAAARRRELALLVAVGLPRRQLWHYWMAEYLYLLLAGLVAGVLPALVAMQPALRSLGQELPVGVMAAVIAAMGATGVLGITAAVLATTRLPLPAALRGE